MLKPIEHILIVDDDRRIRALLSQFLQDEGYVVSVADGGEEARRLFKEFVFDVIIMDVMMPGETGIELTRWIRQAMDVPVLMLTAMGEVDDRIEGLESGADDYLPKPFEPRELLLRIERILERVRKSAQDTSLITLGELTFHTKTGTLFRGEEIVPLTSNEAKLLHVLSQHGGNTISREMLSSLSNGVSERSIDVQITRLRNKIEPDPKQPVFLKTVRGEGYVLHSG